MILVAQLRSTGRLMIECSDKSARMRGLTTTHLCRRNVIMGAVLVLIQGVACADTIQAIAESTSAPAKEEKKQSGQNAEQTFNPAFLSGSSKGLDLKRFERGNVTLPGTYRVDVFINDQWMGISTVVFRAPDSGSSAHACYTRELLLRANVNFEKLQAEAMKQLSVPSACVSLQSLLPDAGERFDSADQRLDITIPQAVQNRVPRGYVNPEFWDLGVTAASLNYTLNTYRTEVQGISQSNTFLGLDAGFNWDRWRFRQSSALSWQSGGASGSRHAWQHMASYVQTSLPGWNAQVTIGDSYTSNDLFDVISIRGIQLGSDDRMLPSSMRGYAPVVRGVADSNAKVTIRQRGYLIYETTVSAGPFEIRDLYATGYGGDLQVTVTEADGRQRIFSVPYANVAQLLRPGVSRFNIAAGRLQQPGLVASVNVAQVTLQHGLNNQMTVYGGIAATPAYRSVLGGVAVNTESGALGLDLTQSQAEIPGAATQNGSSLRISYNLSLPKTDTNLAIAAYRYSTSGFLNLTDAALLRDSAKLGLLPSLDRSRNRLSLSLNQRLGNQSGTLYLMGTTQNYWNRSGNDTQFQVGYNNHIGRLNYNLSVTRSKDVFSNQYVNQFYLGFSLPLDDENGHAKNITASLTSSQPGGATAGLASFNATAGERNEFSYGASLSNDSNAGSAVNAIGEYRGPYARLALSAGKGRNYSQQSLSAAGSIVLHEGGLLFGQSLGETIGIVEAPGAAGAEIANASGVRLNQQGSAIVPYMTPFVRNTIEVSPKGLPLDVQFESTTQEVAPYAGAIVKMRFKTSHQRMAIIQSALPDGSPIPFGAQVTDHAQQAVGIVSQGGRIFAQLPASRGTLRVSWMADDQADGCTLQYQVPEKKSGSNVEQAYEIIKTTCLPKGTAFAKVADNQIVGVQP